MLLATAAAAGGGPAAALPWDGGTLLGRLLQHLADLGITDLHVVTRPEWAAALQPLTADAGLGAELHLAAGAVEDLQAVAGLARRASGPVVLAYGDLVTQREALARLLAEPRIATGALAAWLRAARPWGHRIRVRRGRVVAAASPYHAVRSPNATFLGVVKVAASDRDRLVAVGERLAALVGGPLPPAWEAQLATRAARWRRALVGRAAIRDGNALPPPEERETAPLTPADEAELAHRLAQAPHDALALLLVGLVRDGAEIGVSRLRGLFWARPLSDREVALAREQVEHYDEERALLDSAVKASDGFFTTFFVSPYSKYIARWAARRGLTPNQVTLVSMGVGVAAAAAFAAGTRPGLVAGALLLQAAFTLDCVDGQLARYTRQFSRFGAWLDSILDRAKEYAVFAGLAIGASAQGDPVWGLAVGALALQTSRHAVDFSFPAVRRQVFAHTKQPPLEEPLDWVGRPKPAAVKTAAPARRPGVGRRAMAAWRAGDRSDRVVWAKKVVAFPIGERFAAISLTAALFGPRTTFMVLLTWGGFAALYVVIGRFLRSRAS